MDWTETHRPRSLKEVVGNSPSLGKLHAWATAWQSGTPPERRAIVLAGPPGTGKTSTALALANDMGWPVIELNASDARNAATIAKVATAGALHQTFGSDGSYSVAAAPAGGSMVARRATKLIILDEADNLYERAGEAGLDASGGDLSDKGGKAQMVETIRRTQQPIILIVNDLYALEKGSGSALKSLAEVLKFTRVNVRSIPPHLRRVCAAEGIDADPALLEALAAKADGDLRAAVRDLQSLCLGRKKVTLQDLNALGGRDTTTSMFDLIRHVLKGKRLEEVRREVWDVDATPDDIVMWVDENIPKEYKDARDLLAGYDMLSRADRYLGRTRRTQNYGLWSYASEMATLGVMTARTKEYRDFVPFGFPQYLSKLGRTKGIRGTKDELAEVLGRSTHMSKRKTRGEQVEVFQFLFQVDREFAVEQAYQLELEDEQVAILLGDAGNARVLKDIRAAVDERLAKEETEPAARAARRGPLDAVKALPADDDDEPEAASSGEGAEGDDDVPAKAPAPKGKASGKATGNAPADAGDEAPKKPTPAAGQKRLF